MKVRLSENFELDMATAVHLMVSGTTGSGKSVAINKFIQHIVENYTCDEVGFIMIDPKQVELSNWNYISHMLMPVITNMEIAKGALKWVVNEMERRYAQMAENEEKQWTGQKIVVVVDELADLMMIDRSGVERNLVRIAQKARAAGIHLVLATQSPRAEVLTGLLRANIPTKMSLRVANGLESRIAIGMNGAENLKGAGNAILLDVEGNEHRFRVDYISDKDVKELVKRECGIA